MRYRLLFIKRSDIISKKIYTKPNNTSIIGFDYGIISRAHMSYITPSVVNMVFSFNIPCRTSGSISPPAAGLHLCVRRERIICWFNMLNPLGKVWDLKGFGSKRNDGYLSECHLKTTTNAHDYRVNKANRKDVLFGNTEDDVDVHLHYRLWYFCLFVCYSTVKNSKQKEDDALHIVTNISPL